MSETVIMPAGIYTIGDIFYLPIPWDEVKQALPLTEDDNMVKGKLDGLDACMVWTGYGDGAFCDQEKRVYCVDSATIGCVRVDEMTNEQYQRFHNHNISNDEQHIHNFYEPFKVWVDGINNSCIHFGNVEIATDWDCR